MLSMLQTLFMYTHDLTIVYIQFDQPTLLLDGRDVYLEEGSAVIDAYVKYATDIAVALGGDYLDP